MADSKVYCDICKVDRLVNKCEVHPDTHVLDYCYYCHLKKDHFGDEVYRSKHNGPLPPPDELPTETFKTPIESVSIP